MKLFLSVCITVLAMSGMYAQTPADTTIYDTVDVQASYYAGDQALLKYLASIPYPPEARENAWMGTAYIRFVVELDGSITNVTVARTSGHEVLDNAVMAHIKGMDQWIPAEKDGKQVRSYIVLPTKFRLDDKTVKKTQKKRK